MSNYDDWKLRTPEDDYEASGGTICPICGAYSLDACELEDFGDDECPLNAGEPDGDYLRDLQMDDRS